MCTNEALHDLNLNIAMIRDDLAMIEEGRFQILSRGEDVTKDWSARMNIVARRLEWIAQSHRGAQA